jgi:hypothetical protein
MENHMLFAIDIDGTISTHTEQRLAYIPYFNRVLNLGLAEEKLATFPDFFAFQQSVILPWASAMREKGTSTEKQANNCNMILIASVPASPFPAPLKVCACLQNTEE